jgi:segregation and condensation protein B
LEVPRSVLPEEKIEEKTDEKPEDKIDKRDLALIEAALYVAGRPLDVNELASVLRTRSKKRVLRTAGKLIELYSTRDTSIEVLALQDERYVLQLKAEYTPEVRRLALRPLLSIGPLKTLSYIAYRQPLPQKQVIDVRGQHAYGHVKQLEDMNLISRERAGRTRLIRTTEFFADYFGLSHDVKTMKQQLKNIFEKEDLDEAPPEKPQPEIL